MKKEIKEMCLSHEFLVPKGGNTKSDEFSEKFQRVEGGTVGEEAT